MCLLQWEGEGCVLPLSLATSFSHYSGRVGSFALVAFISSTFHYYSICAPFLDENKRMLRIYLWIDLFQSQSSTNFSPSLYPFLLLFSSLYLSSRLTGSRQLLGIARGCQVSTVLIAVVSNTAIHFISLPHEPVSEFFASGMIVLKLCAHRSLWESEISPRLLYSMSVCSRLWLKKINLEVEP